jgi:hypothetical protein
MTILKEFSAIKLIKRLKPNDYAMEVIEHKYIFIPDTSEPEFENANRLYSLIRKK